MSDWSKKDAARILYEVSAWAGRKRDGLIRPPLAIHRREDCDLWRDGYYAAMNEVAQHFNMERLSAERAKTQETAAQPEG
jgi:hypothetical protein